VEKGVRGGAHRRRGGQLGTEAMLSAAACFGASGWMRRQGGVGQGLSLAQEGGEIGRERKRGCGGGDIRFNGDRRCRLEEGGQPRVASRGEEVGARHGASMEVGR
jgi:hypothetical protein